ncbi:bifunctional Tetratricopeptide-like helical domain superfamily/HAT (Half-A-TPR) repeat/RNA-binding domain superfamily/RNA recognition motif domain [Babesia duncani]|uniref:Bifunctional Tetratricopeptide-like helical domain superfamily/HAT (Half-A-TPR) repeat/RNA-binding domain superfamily/RNA recognition motif domain n=1 Tax=Babesia duncani TaxID=323732 RepID=A0AAD9PK11_9APIC|nr:bifunctional Tetratricopeptide-like helical domain superfamily/HAT (Half-A-TPR) repeat/RNA-binding domain superfamily/RNA recognition motif domain [Babesia duncani]
MCTSNPTKDSGLNIAEIESIKEQLKSNPWDLELYKRGIYLTSIFKDIESLSYFRAACIEYCVADEAFWLAYIEDFKKDASESQISALYEKAIKNEPCVEIWLSYLRHVSSQCPDVYTRQDVVDLFERSLVMLGLHALDGPLLWSEYRQFESLNVDSIVTGLQLPKIRSLFYRQLQLPLSGLADLLDEYLSWEGELPPEHQNDPCKGKSLHKLGFDAWEKRKPFEFRTQSEYDEVVNPGNMSTVWNDYIEFEKTNGDAGQISIVYHRALDDLGYERDDLWVNYATFVRSFNLQGALDICERATRHMPKSTNIWILYLMLLSEATISIDELLQIYNKAMLALTETGPLVTLHITVATVLNRMYPNAIEDFRKIMAQGELLAVSRQDATSESRNLFRLLSFWGKQELRHATCGGECTEYLKILGRMLKHYRHDAIAFMYAIGGLKELERIGILYQILVQAHEHLCGAFSHTCKCKEFQSGHELIIWLYEAGLKTSSANALAEEYIDYVQHFNIEDIKKAHMTVASLDNTSVEPARNIGTLSLNNIILRRSRRRKSESYSETSSDSGSIASRSRYMYMYSGQCKSQSLHASPRLTVKDFEMATRATWDGGESADPSLAPAIPPALPMPPPFSPICMQPQPNTISQPLMLEVSRQNSSESLLELPTEPEALDHLHGKGGDVDIKRRHHLLAKEHEAVISWLEGHAESSTLYLSCLKDDQNPKELLGGFPGFLEARMQPNLRSCYVEFGSQQEAQTALEAIKSEKHSFNIDFSKPSRPLFEERVVFCRKIVCEVPMDPPILVQVITGYFSSIGYTPAQVRLVQQLSQTNGIADYCYVEFKSVNAKKVIQALLQLYGWPIGVKIGKVTFQVAPSIPIIKKRTSPRIGTLHAPNKDDSLMDRTLYITNIDPETTHVQLRQCLESEIGPLDNLYLCKRRNYAYACLVHESDATNGLDGPEIKLGNSILSIVKSTRPFPCKPPTVHAGGTHLEGHSGDSDRPKRSREQEKRRRNKDYQAVLVARQLKPRKRLDL